MFNVTIQPPAQPSMPSSNPGDWPKGTYVSDEGNVIVCDHSAGPVWMCPHGVWQISNRAHVGSGFRLAAAGTIITIEVK